MQCDCGTEIVFREHVTTGNKAPIEAVPAAKGNTRLLPRQRYEVLSGQELALAEPPLYLNHRATCTTWRKTR